MFKTKEFKLIVAGGRDFVDYRRLEAELMELTNGLYTDRDVSIISGLARGAAALAVEFARKHDVLLYGFPADLSQGKGAGFARNKDMAKHADGLLAFWDGKSRGTAHMIQTMSDLGKVVHIRRY